MRLPSGVSDQYIYFVAVDATDLKTREPGLSGFTVYRSRNGGVATAYTTPTINETDTTNMPGVYELLVDEDVTLDAGDQSQEICLHITHASMAPVTRVIELYRPSVTAGETITVSGGTVGAVTTTTNVTTVNGLAANVITTASINDGAITAAKIADGAIDAATFAAGAINAAAIAADAITDAKVAADVTIASVTGSVGSVAGAVGSVTAGVTVTTNNDKTGYALSAAGVDAIWDEPLTAATHDVDQSAGARLRGLDVISGSVNDAGATTSAFITDLASTVDNFYQDLYLRFTSGALKDVARQIYSYTQATKTISLDEALPSAPANGVTFDIISLHVHALTTIGTYAANATWDTDATTHQTQGTFGQAIGDPAADTNTIYKAVVSDATGATVGVDVVAVKSDTAAVKVQTDKFVFTVANQVDANIQYVNDVLVTGTGAPGTEWGP